MALQLLDIAQGAVLQRRAGTTACRVPARFAYDTQLGPLQGRVIRADGSAVVDWAYLTNLSLSGGTGVGFVPNVPQGDGYRLQIRDESSGATVAGSNAWGVGCVFAFHGQSNMLAILNGGWNGQEMGLLPNYGARVRSFDGQGWRSLGQNAWNNDSLYLFCREMVAALGGNVPLGVVPVAANSRSITAFLPGGDIHSSFFAASGTTAGSIGYASPPDVWSGDLEGVFWHQGEADTGQTTAWYKERLGQLHQGFLSRVAPYNRTAASFLFAPCVISSENPLAGRKVGPIRRAVLEYVAERRALGDAVDLGCSTLDFATDPADDLHFGYTNARMAMRRLVQGAKKHLGLAPHGGCGPAIASMGRTGNTVTVTVAHDGGTALRTARGGAPSGFALSTDGFASDRRVPTGTALQGANRIVLTLPAGIAASTPVSVAYLEAIPGLATALLPTPGGYPYPSAVIDGDSRPDVTDALFDDAAICPPSPGYGDPVAPGLPLQPTYRLWTLADGQTLTAPAGATTSGSTTSGVPLGTTGGATTGGVPSGTTGGTSTGSNRAPFVLLNKPGGRPILHKAGGRPLLSGTAVASGTVQVRVTGLVLESLSGGDLVTRWTAYPGAAYYRQESSTDGGATWESWGRSVETRFSKGGLANGPRLVRVVAMTGQINGVDDIAGSASEPLSVTVGASAGGSNAQPLDPSSGGSTGGTGTPSGGTLPSGASAGGTLTLATSVRLPSAGTEPVVRFLQGFAPGEMGDGDWLAATLADGTAVPLRPSARRRTWPAGMGGGVRSRTYDATLPPGAYTAGQVVPLTLTKQSGAADLGTAKTLTAMAADSDLKVKFYGYDLGADVFWVKARDLIQGQAPSIPYGVNPLRGLDIISANQERVSARGWAFVRTDDGRIHRTLKGFLYFDWVRGGGGGYLCGVAWRQDTAYGSHPAGTVGPTDGPKRLRFIVELYDGDRRLHAWGGPNDARARTVDASAFANNLYAAPAGQPLGLDWDGGVGVGVQAVASATSEGANLPSGLSAANAYYVRRVDGGLGFFTRRRDGNTRVTWSGGSGGITVFPVMHSYAGQGGYGLDTDGGRVWSGAGAKPEAWFAPDQPHLFKRTRLVPPYGDHVNRTPMGGNPPIYTPGEVYGSIIWTIQAPSDDPEASRLGPVPYFHARWLLTPHDPVSRALSLRQAASWADFPTWFSDERSGCPVVTSRGPNGDGVTYPGLGPVNPSFSCILNDTNGSPAFGPAQHEAWRGPLDHRHGYDEDYQQANTFAHTPNFWQVPHILTGDQMWLDMGAASCAAAGYLWGHEYSVGGKAYSPVLRGQQRGVAWALREWSNFDGQAPDDDPLRVLFADYLRINGEFYATYSRTAQARHLGKPYLPGEGNDVGGRPFQEYMLAFMCGMHLWRTQDADWREFMDCTGRFIIGAFDDLVPGAGGGASNRGWLANEYGLQGNDFQNVLGRGAGAIWTSVEEMLRHSNEPAFGIPQAGPAPYPQYGLRRDDAGFDNATYRFNAIAYVHMLVGALAVWSSAGIPNAKRVREQILRRIYDGTLKEIPVNSTVGPIPQYACVPVPGSPD